MLKTPKLEVPQDQAKRIGQIICEEIKRSLTENKSIYDRAQKRQDAYNQVTKWQAQGKVCDKPWLGAADYFIPLIEWTIDAVWARILQKLFSQEPYMTAVGESADDKPKEDGVTQFVDVMLREKIRLYENTNFYFKQPLILPFAVLKYDWVRDYDTIIRKDSASVWLNPTGKEEYILPSDPQVQVKMAQFTANGYQEQGQQDVWTAEDVELYNAPKAQYIRFADYVWSPKAKRDVPLYWEGDRIWFTPNDLKRLAKQPDGFIKEAVERIVTKSGTNKEGTDKDIAPRTELHECFNWYGRLPFNNQSEIDLDGEDTIEQEVFCIVEYIDKELLQVELWDKKRLPIPDRVYLRLQFEETEEFIGRSLTDKLFSTNRYLNHMFNTIMNNAMIAMQKVFVKKTNVQGTKWEKPPIFPGAMWTVDTLGDISTLDVGDVKNIGLEVQQTLLNFAERISNVSITTTGAERQTGQKTLGEIQATIFEGNIGMDKYLQRCHKILVNICKWTIDYYYDNMPLGLERRILGEEGEQIFPTQDNLPMYQQKGVNPYWSKDDIAGQFDFQWRGTSLNSSKEYQLAVVNDLMDRYLPQQMVAGNMLAVWEILKRGLLARGIKDWQNILPTHDAIVQEMQLMQQEAQQAQADAMAAKQNAQAQGIEAQSKARQPSKGQMVVKKLTDKGMPMNEALKAVKTRMTNEKAVAIT